MNNILEINGYRALIQYDPDIEMFRGEFLELNGGADFYATDLEGLKREGALSLKVFLEMCLEDGVEPLKKFSGKFNLRLPKELHAEITLAASAAGKSLNQWVVEAISQKTHEAY